MRSIDETAFIRIRYFRLQVLCYTISLKIWHIFVSNILSLRHSIHLKYCEHFVVYSPRSALVTRKMRFPMARTRQGSKILPYLQVERGQLPRVSWLLVEDKDSWVRDKGYYYSKELQKPEFQHSHLFLNSRSQKSDSKRDIRWLHMQQVGLQKRIFEFSGFQSFLEVIKFA